MSNFIASWLSVAAEVIETEFSRPVDLLPGAAIPANAAHFTLMAELAGDWSGSFSVTADEAALVALFAALKDLPGQSEDPAGADPAGADPAGEGPENVGRPNATEVREAWQALFQRICAAAAAALTLESGRSSEVTMISLRETAAGAEGMSYEMRVGESTVALAIADQVEAELLDPRPSPAGTQTGPSQPESASPSASSSAPASSAAAGSAGPESPPLESTTDASASPGIDLLRGVELEASLRFGSREMTLGELLALGPGDVIQLDRALADPVDLVVGDKIIASGEVVLVNGNFGLRVTAVAEPRKSLESIRCLF